MHKNTVAPMKHEHAILHEDDYLLVLDKPAGVAVHPGHTDDGGDTIADWFQGKITDPGSRRPGIIHRLDKDTSGVLVIAKDPQTKAFLQQQFKSRSVTKHYIAAVQGVPEPRRARLDLPIGRHPKNPLKRTVRPNGKPAVTEYQVTETKADKSLVDIHPLTGRTHQIRVHMQYIGHPVLGDKVYGTRYPGLNRHFLHASGITLTHPEDGNERTFESELPGDLYRVWYNGV